MKRLKAYAALMAIVGLAGCTTIDRVPAGPVALGGGQSVNLQSDWADITGILPQKQNGVRVLSVDGPLLDRLYLIQGLSPGQGLIKRAGKDKPIPVFEADMSPSELVEFVTDSVAALGYQRVSSTDLRPGRFGSADGLRFDLNAVTPSGLDITGTAQIAVVSQKLIGIVFLAPSEHYFPAMLPQVEPMLGVATAAAIKPAAYERSYETRVDNSLAAPAPTLAVEPVRSQPKPVAPASSPARQCGWVEQPNGVLKLVPCR